MTLCNTPLSDGSRCRSTLIRTKEGVWIELECPSCGFQASRHQDSTGPVQETGEEHSDQPHRWWGEKD